MTNTKYTPAEADAYLRSLTEDAERELDGIFRDIDRVSANNTERILKLFREHRVSEPLFAPTSGYGYDDRGRDELDRIWADAFGCEAAFVRHSIASGTHALAIALFGLLRTGDVMLAATGKPYDTLDEVIGIAGEAGRGSLADYGISYEQIDLIEGKKINIPAVIEALSRPDTHIRVVFVQRSRGYLDRYALSVDEIGELAREVHRVSDAYVVVDNCYGEFTTEYEPTAVGADLCVGSLIKNPGGGMAESGGYIAGSARAVELCGYRLTAVGVGLEIGATLGQTKSLYKGLFYAPHTVAQALKTAVFAAYVFEKMGLRVSPSYTEARHDIIQTVECATPEGLCAFCRGIQAGSPVDSFVTPEPWAMPGYLDEIIMAAGTFVSGASIELSADGPLRPPYTAFMQGGLTYESGKYGILCAAREMLLL